MWEINVPIKRSRPSTSSIVLLVVVILLTTVLYFYNNNLDKQISDLQNNISSLKTNISEVEKDKNLQVYYLVELNKKILSTYEKMNNVTKYINHFNVISNKYNLKLEGFSLSKWEITTQAKVTSDNKAIAFQKTRDFISNYRKDSKALFDLGFINSIEWMDDMKFKLTFKIK